MKLLIKQRFFSWLDSYDVYREDETTAFRVEGKLAWGHKLEIQDSQGRPLGTVREELFTFLPRFALYVGDNCIGCVRKEFSFFKPVYSLDVQGWTVEGDWLGWDYRVLDGQGRMVMQLSKELFHWTDTYVLDIVHERDELLCLMVVLAIDAANCSNR